MNKWVYTVAALMTTVLLHPATSVATDISGRLSAAVEWYDAPNGDSSTPAYLYGFLNASKIGDISGLNFRGYGRLADDLSNEVNKDSRLYNAYLEKKNLLPGLDVRAGRQFISNTAGATTLDGVDLGYKVYGPVKAKAFFGGAVAFDDDYDSGNLALGGELRAQWVDYEAAVSYYQEKDDSAMTRELIGIDLRYDLMKALEFSGEFQYNYLGGEWSHAYVDATYHRSPVWGLKAHYLMDLPVFDSTSIYSVFASEAYEEWGVDATYNISDSLRAVCRLTQEVYDTGSDASVFEAGIETSGYGPMDAYALATYRAAGDGQDLSGVKLMFSYEVNRYFTPGVGLHWDSLERRFEEDDRTTSQRLFAFVRSNVTDAFSLEAKIEQSQSDLYDNYFQGRLQANYRF